MTTYTWTGAAGDNNYGNAGNWTPSGGPPGAADTASISVSTATTISVSGDAIGNLTTNSFVTLAVANNNSFNFGTNSGSAVTFSNGGTFAVESGGNTTDLIVAATTLSLTGSGTILMSNNSQNFIEGAVGGNVLNNVNNLIEGAGDIGAGTLSFINGTAGTVNANQSNALAINTASAITSNSGTLESTSTGGLYIESIVNNGAAGKIIAAGGNVVLQNGEIQGGTLSTSGGAEIINNASGTLDGTAHTLANTGTVFVQNNTALALLGTIANSGTLSLGSTGNATNLAIGPAATAGTVTLTGGGQVVLSDNLQNLIGGADAGNTLVNLNNTISGAGSFTSSLTLVNDATINSNAGTNALVIDTAATVTNNSLLEATVATNGGLVIASVVNSSGGGTILAAGGNVYLAAGTLQGGTIKTSGGGEVYETATGTLDGSAHAVTNLGTVTIDNNEALNLLGSIVNNGTIAAASVGNSTYFEIDSAVVTLTGTGTIQLSNFNNNYIFGAAATDELDNATNVIDGAGQFGGVGSLTLVNGAAGVINSNTSAGLTLTVGATPIVNSGLIEATAGGALSVNSSTVDDSTGGTILAAGANVYLNTGTIIGGVLNSSGGGAIVANSGTNLLNGATQAVTNKGVVAVSNNEFLALAGTITNSGTIQLNSTGNTTVLEDNSATLTLNGSGLVVLSDVASNYIYGAVAADVLDNVNNTIEGSGQLGDNQLTLINAAAGTISATGTNASLVIATGTISVTNSGLIEAIGPAGLVVESTIANGTLGVLSANGGNIYLQGGDVQGGTLKFTGTGSFFDNTGATLDGSVNTVINDATVTIDNNETLSLLGTITNAGTISVASGNNTTELQIGSSSAVSTVTLTGSGQVVMSNISANYILAADAGNTLINLNNTISGGGTLGYNALFITNDATVNANAATALVIDPTETFTNNKLLESTSTGGLTIASTTISNGTAGTISANGGSVTLSNATIQGGTLSGTGGFFANGTDVLDGSAHSIVNSAAITINNNQALQLLGTISNSGTILVDSGNNNTDLQIGPSGAIGTVTLTGGGQLQISDNANNYIYALTAGSTLVNLNNTISGAGILGDNALFIINDSIVNANAATNAMVINPTEAFTNNDLIESTSSGGLDINSTTISNGTKGTISAAGGTVSLSSATIQGGTLTGTSGFFANATDIFDGTANTLVNKATVTVNNNQALNLLGTISNAGTILVDSGNNSTDLLIGSGSVASTVTLTGGGQLQISDNANNYIYALTAGSTLINLNNTISGAGTLGYNALFITNDSVIDATGAANALVIDGSEPVTNNGLIESTNTGGMVITSVVNSSGGGTVAASAGYITLQGGTLEGGLVTSTGTYAVSLTNGAILGASTGTLTNSGSIVLVNNNTAYLDGAIVNTGAIEEDSTNNATSFIINTPTVTLSGTGTLLLSDNANNYVYGAAAADVFDNVGNTVEGAGNFGDGQMSLLNGGIIEATGTNVLYLDLGTSGSGGTNLAGGQVLGISAAGLSIENGTYTNAGLIQADDGSSVTFQSNATLTNSVNGTLTGGSYGAVSTGDGATLSVTGSAVTTLAATIILSGATSTVAFGGTTIDASLQTIAAGGTLSLVNGRVFDPTANSGALSDGGVVSLAGGTLTTAPLTIASGGTLSGYGSVTGAVADGGTIAASGGTLVFSGAVTGTGALTAASGATVNLTTGGALTEAISGAGTLQLDGAYTVAGNTITIGNVLVDASASLSGNGTLAGLTDNGTVTASSGTLLVDGKLAGSGSLSASSGAVLDLAGGGTFAGPMSGTGTIEIAGATTLTAGASLTAAHVLETANLTLSGIGITNSAGDTFTMTASSGSTVALGYTGAGSGTSFTNAGSFLANGAGTAKIMPAFTDTGTASVTTGTLLIAGKFGGTGTLSAGTGAVLDIAGGGGFAGAINGAGTVDIAGATTLTAGASLTAVHVLETANLTLSGIGITNSAGDTFTMTASSGSTVALGYTGAGSGTSFTNAGAFLANGAGTAKIMPAFTDTGTASVTAGTLLIAGKFGGTGTLSAGTGAVLDIAGGGGFAGAINGAGTVEIAGATTLTAGASLTAAHVLETANLTLSGIGITNSAGDTFTMAASSGTTVALGYTGAGSGTSFTNAGAFLANGAGTAEIMPAFTDTGTASVTAGTLLIAGKFGGTGTLSAGTGAVLDIAGGGGFAGAINGAGTVEIAGATTLTAGASLTAAHVLETANLTLNGTAITNSAGDTFTITASSGATVALSSTGTGTGFTNAGTVLANGAGTAEIVPAFTDTGTASVTAGTLLIAGKLGGTGTLSAGTGAVLDIAGGGGFAGAIDGAGTVEIAGATTLTAGASLTAAHVLETANLTLSGIGITNSAGDTFTMAASSGTTVALGYTGLGSGTSFTNAGAFLANGAGTAEIMPAFTDTGTASVTAGTLLIAGKFGGTGTLSAGTGAVLDIAGGGGFAGAINGAGTVDIAGATTLTAGASLTAVHVLETANLTLSGIGITNSAGDTFTMTASSGSTVTLGFTGLGAGTSFTNAGSLVTNGAGTVVIDPSFIDNGLVSATAGGLLISGKLSGSGTLSASANVGIELSGGGTFGGALSGAGQIIIDAATTLTAGASITAAQVYDYANLVLSGAAITNGAGDTFNLISSSGTTVTLGGTGSFSNTGTFNASGSGTDLISTGFTNTGTVSLAGTLVVSGKLAGSGLFYAETGTLLDLAGGGSYAGAISGGGTLDIVGATTLTAGASISTSHVLETGNLTLSGIGITNSAGDTFTMTASSDTTVALGYTGAGSGTSFTNAGTFIASGMGTAEIKPAFTDTGTASVTAGTLLIAGKFGGSGTLTAGTGAVLDIAGGGGFSGAINGAGTIDIAGATTLDAGASLSAAAVLETANLTLDGMAITNGSGDVFTITAASGTTVTLGTTGSGTGFTNAGSLVANGTGIAKISPAFTDTGTASVTAGTLLVAGKLAGSGTLTAAAGTLLDLAGGGTFAGAMSGTGTIEIAGATTLTAGASITASHVLETGNVSLTGIALTNGSGDIFTLTAASGSTVTLGYTGYGNGTSLTNAGSVVGSGTGTEDIKLATTNTGSISATSGTLAFLGNVTNNGTLNAASGVVSIATKVAGTGTLDVGTTGTLSLALGAASGQGVDFLGSTGLLDLAAPLDFAGTITGFGGSDMVDLLNTTYTTDSYANNVLTVKNGSTTVASLHFAGASNSFSLSEVGSTTVIKFG